MAAFSYYYFDETCSTDQIVLIIDKQCPAASTAFTFELAEIPPEIETHPYPEIKIKKAHK